MFGTLFASLTAGDIAAYEPFAALIALQLACSGMLGRHPAESELRRAVEGCSAVRQRTPAGTRGCSAGFLLSPLGWGWHGPCTRASGEVMMNGASRVGSLAGLALVATVQCGGEPPALLVEERTSEQMRGRFASEGQVAEFSSARSAPLVGDVVITVGSVTYELHYDYAARRVVADGHGGALDRPTHALLRDALASVAAYFRDDEAAELPLEEQMLYAGLTLLSESGGMQLPRIVFELGGEQVDKSLGNDGVTCIEKGSTHAVSFDDASGATHDVPVTAGAVDCNGQCGPTCSRLTPWVMWTLDCLEHDKCCDATGDSACWVPLGQCGDEYVDAESDFLRGFDPLSRHCGG